MSGAVSFGGANPRHARTVLVVGLMNLLTLPVRVTVAYAQATIGVAQLFAPGGPIRIVYRLADLTDEDRPLGQALAAGGTFDRLLSGGGVLVQLTDFSGPLGRLIEPGGPLDRIVAEDGLLDQLMVQGGAVDQLIDLAEVLAGLIPLLDRLDEPTRRLSEAANELGSAVRPLTATMETLAEFMPRIPGLPHVLRRD